MNFLQKATAWLARIPTPGKKNGERTYREVASMGGVNSDWAVSLVGEDSELWQNAWALTSRCRDLARCNPIFQAYRETVWSNVFGANGIMCRPKIKETEDRVIHTPDEAKFLENYEARRNRVYEFYATKAGQEFVARTMLRCLGTNGSRQAMIKVGEPDVYAGQMIQKAWKKWQRKEFCDARGARNYKTIRQIRLWSAIRDGDFFIRKIATPSVNSFGFALQLINAEWCDRFYNTILTNGNEVRMGIEYQFNAWGIGNPVAYYFIKRQPQDWQWSIPGAFNFSKGDLHVRIPAEQIIHYARAVDAEGTRPAPWIVSTIPSARQIDQAMLAEVIAWRQSACKTGFYYSDVNPEGGAAEVLPDPAGNNLESMAPGEIRALKWGTKYQANDPHHPNASVKDFRMAAIQSMVAGMPGSNYSTMANDYAAINFSAGRLQRLDSNECFEILQTFDIDYAERPIFEAWLEMALIVGKEIPLPLNKLDKFKAAHFQGRRWAGVDEVKEVTASALRVANHFSSDYKECEQKGIDFEETLFEQAEANMLKEELGIDPAKTVQSGAPMVADADDGETTPTNGDSPDAGKNPAKKAPTKKGARKAKIERFAEQEYRA